jgi:hypothetical protein
MKKNELNAVPVSEHFEEGHALRSSLRASGQAGRAEARLYNGATPILKNKKLIPERNCDGKKWQQGCRTPKLDSESLWKQIDHVVYSHLARHSRLEGKRRLRFSILWLARNIHLSGGPTRDAVRRLAGQGALRLIERSKAGHVVEVRLPEEIRGVRGNAIRACKAARLYSVNGIEDVDFLKTLELRRAIHARERGKCFYCLRRIAAGWSAWTTWCPARDCGAIHTATWSLLVWNATRKKESARPRNFCAGCSASAA